MEHRSFCPPPPPKRVKILFCFKKKNVLKKLDQRIYIFGQIYRFLPIPIPILSCVRRGVPLSPHIKMTWTKNRILISNTHWDYLSAYFLRKKIICPYTDINLWVIDTDKKSFRPIHHLPFYTYTDSNWFLGLLTLPNSDMNIIPIPIFWKILIYQYRYRLYRWSV